MNESGDPLITDADQAMLDTYIDGCLTPEQAAAFEQRLAQEPRLQAEYQLQQRIDHAIERTISAESQHAGFTPEQLRDMLSREQPPAPGPTRLWPGPATLRWAAMVALAVLIGGGAFLLSRSGEPEDYAELQYITIAAVYEEELQQGFEPDWVCDNQRFTETIQEKLGQQLALAQMPGDRRMLGLSYLPRGRADSVYMLGRFDGQPVLVFFDHPQFVDQFYDQAVSEGRFAHTRDIGQLRAIEVSSHPEPVFLDFLK